MKEISEKGLEDKCDNLMQIIRVIRIIKEEKETDAEMHI